MTARRGVGGRRSQRENQGKGRHPGTEDQAAGRGDLGQARGGGLKTGVDGEKQCQYTVSTKTQSILDDDQVERSQESARG